MQTYLQAALIGLALLVGVYRYLLHYQKRKVCPSIFEDQFRGIDRQQSLRAFAKQHGCQPPPRVRTHRPLGLDRVEELFRSDAEGRLMQAFTFHFRQTGYTLEKVLLGFKSIDTAEPANVEAILSTNFSHWSFGPRAKITEPMFGEGIFTQEGPAWKRSREILRPQFHHKRYATLDVFRESVENLLDVIARKDGIVDLQPLFFRLTLDVTTAFLFGESVQSLKGVAKGNEGSFAKAFDTAQAYIVRRFRLMDIYWIVGGKKFRQACNDVHHFADRIIERNLAAGAEKPGTGTGDTFLNALIENSLSRLAIRGQIINILAAGRDTTACLLSWTFYLLARHPQVLSKLQEEIRSSIPDVHNINREKLRNLKYLQNVLKETLRLYPPVPVNIRVACCDTILPTGGGSDHESPIFVPRGTAAGISTYTLHRRPDLYGIDAELFRPERWDEDLPLMKSDTWARWGWIPFNGGPRVCLGMDFAITEAAYTVVRILDRFGSIQLPPNTPTEIIGTEKQTMTLVLSLTEGCLLELR